MDRYLVSAETDGWWCAGRRWQTEPAEVGADELTPDQWGRLEADPAIAVEPVPERRRELPHDPVEVDAADYEAALARIAELTADLDAARSTIAQLTARIAELESERTSTREEEVDPPKGAGSPDPAPAGEHPTRAERILGAVATSLEADGPEHRTRTGRPVLARVREISGVEDATAAERDAAWAAVRGPAGG
ncbi:MAG: hypothetical protein OXI79_20355 [Gammaproteobacteria bacterium]|nr:hypothetical protein [Gammaproteobacteria bacterium]